MKKWFLRCAVVLLTIFGVAGLVYHLGLRNWCMRWGTTPAEVQSTLPGDDLLPSYASEVTHAITVHAPVEKIWPWLMQIGHDRSGFCSYTFLENAIGADMPRVEHLVPGWKPRSCRRDGVVYRAQGFWRAGTHDRSSGAATTIHRDGHAERLGAAAGWQARAGRALDFTLAPLQDGQTRLIARLRGGMPPTFASRAMDRLFWEPAHFVMEQKMLRTIRDLAERS